MGVLLRFLSQECGAEVAFGTVGEDGGDISFDFPGELSGSPYIGT